MHDLQEVSSSELNPNADIENLDAEQAHMQELQDALQQETSMFNRLLVNMFNAVSPHYIIQVNPCFP